MLARSSALALLLLGGCDFVFGVSGQPEPCALASFDGAAATPLFEADAFSVDWDQTFAVIEQGGLMYDVTLPDGALTPTDVGVYNHITLALTPEGDALLYTIAVEPLTLKGALRGSTDTWRLDAAVPRGTFAGTPSADAFGPRRVLVRMLAETQDVQEYVDDNGRWMPIGAPFMLNAYASPNLTPNGLTMVYGSSDAAGTPGIYAASRDTVDDPFSEPTLLLAGDYRVPQLCGKCQQLYAIANNMVVRFDR